MAYAREEKQTFEIDYSLEKVWAAIPQAIETLDWTIEETDDQAHKAKIKSKPGFFAYSTILNVELKSVDEKTTKLTVNAETPVTTITSIADFGRTRDRLEQFVDTLAKEMDKKKTSVKTDSQNSNMRL
jgi:carbon monoxide dehydrogenase subunit G